jgi:hypothetical protein
VTHFSIFLQNICRLSASIFIDPSTEDAAFLRTAIKLINSALLVVSHYYKLKSHTDETIQKQNVHVIVTR